MRSKAQAALLINIVIGIIFLVLAFAFFLYANVKVTDAKEHSINQVLQTDMLATYTGVLSKMESINLQGFSELDAVLDADPDSFTNVRNFETFQNTILTATSEHERMHCYSTPDVIKILTNPSSYVPDALPFKDSLNMESSAREFLPGWFFFTSTDDSVQASHLCGLFTTGFQRRYIE